MDENGLNQELERIYGSDNARMIRTIFQEIDRHTDRTRESPLNALVSSTYFKKGYMSQDYFEKLVGERDRLGRVKVDVVESLRDYVERVKVNVKKGVLSKITPQDVACALAYDNPSLNSAGPIKGIPDVRGSGGRRVYTGQSQVQGSGVL